MNLVCVCVRNLVNVLVRGVNGFVLLNGVVSEAKDERLCLVSGCLWY